MVKVLLFASIRELIKEKYIIVNGSNIQELIDNIKYSYPVVEEILNTCVFSVNRNIVNDYSMEIFSSDELAIIPPISSG
jgi:molybdopterin converting factor small subunit